MEGSGIEVDLFRYCSDPAFVQRLQLLRLKLFSQINEIVFYGKGGYDFNTVYSMPIWLRHFTYKQIAEAYRKEAEAAKAASEEGKQTLHQPPNVRVPNYSVGRSAK